MKTRSLLIAVYVIISAFVVLNTSIARADVQVYDNNNQHLGVLIHMREGDIDLFIPFLAGTFIYSDDYLGWCGDELEVYFASDDCTGTPYSEGPNPLIFDFSYTPREGFYKVDYNGKQTFSPSSRYVANNQTLDCECASFSEPSAEYYPYVQVQMPFTTPIAYPLSFEVQTQSELIPFPIVVAPKNQ